MEYPHSCTKQRSHRDCKLWRALLNLVVDGNISDFIGNSDYRMTSKNSASLIFRHPSLKLDNIRRGKSQRKSTLLHPIQAHFRHLALACVHFSSAEMDTARSPKRREPTTSLSCRLLQNHSISRPVVGSTSLLIYRVVHPVQSKDRDVALRLLLSRLVEAVSRLVEAVSRLMEKWAGQWKRGGDPKQTPGSSSR